jgi:hypothetical protein
MRDASSKAGVHALPTASGCVLAVGLVAVGVPAAAQEAPPPHRLEKPGVLSEPRPVSTAVDVAGYFLAERHADPGGGFELTYGGLSPGAGWLAAGPRHRHRLFDGRGTAELSATVSWRAYVLARAGFEFADLRSSRWSAGIQTSWQDFTQVDHFGVGSDSRRSDRSAYRIKAIDVVGYATYRPRRWLFVAGAAGYLTPSRVLEPAGPFDRADVSSATKFPDEPAIAASEPPAFRHLSVSVAADWRDYAGHPTRGGLYRARAAWFDDRATNTFTLRRLELQIAQFVPLVADRWTLAGHAAVATSSTRAGQLVPLYLMPSLGGGVTLRSHPNFRYQDRHLLAATVESRVALFMHLDAVAFVDAGGVAARAADLGLSHTSLGVGVRVHSRRSTIARVDLAHGREGWRALFSLSDPFRFRRIAWPIVMLPPAW